LFSEVNGQERLEIFPKSADTFFLETVEAEMTFVKNDKGQVVKAILKQRGLTVEAVKLAKENGL